MKFAIIGLVLGMFMVGCVANQPKTVSCTGIAGCYDKAFNICGRDWHQVPIEGEAFASATLIEDHYDMLFVCGK